MIWGIVIWFAIWIIPCNWYFVWLEHGWASFTKFKETFLVTAGSAAMALFIGWGLLPGLSMLKFLFK